MGIIENNNGVFLLNTTDTSYMFRVDRYGHLEHIHYGSRVDIGDSEALAVKRQILYGTTVVYDKDDQIYTLDSLPQEYGTYGSGDFREASLELEDPASYTSDFIFDSFTVIDGDTRIEGLPNAYGASRTLLIHLKDETAGLKLDLYYGIYPEENVISRRAVLYNGSDKKYKIHKMMSFCVDLFADDLVMMDLAGAWDKEAHLSVHPINQGTSVISSGTGFSSYKHNPGFILRKSGTGENRGRCWGFNLIYSGNHYASVSRDEYGINRIQSGISPERFVHDLHPGESFSTPEAVLTYADEGLNRLSQNFHAFINEHIVRSDWKKKERPILINSWEGFGFDFRKEDLINKLAKNANKLGIELFVLDDGWFGRRSNDTRGLGDYDCNLKKIPGGIASLSEEIHKLGMLFGIWVEPEAINMDSALYENHPDWALVEQGRKPLFGRNELLMDLTRQEVRDYIVENVARLIDDNNVDYIKWDMNRLMNGVSGDFNHAYIKGLYEVLDRIFTPRPQVLLESCSSGGNRFDLGMLCYSPQIWASDDTDPIERLDIQKGLSYFYPLSAMGAHVSASPHMQTLRTTPLETRFAVSAYGCLGYELDLSLLTALEKHEIRNQVEYYKQHRYTFQFGTFYRHEEEKDHETFEAVGENEALVTKYRRLVHAVPLNDRLFARGLADEKNYLITSRPYTHNIRQFGNLINFAIPIKVNSEGKLVDTISNYRGIKAADQEYRASGRALKYGIVLNNLFEGTGYNDRIRVPLDFGSDMYLIREKKK